VDALIYERSPVSAALVWKLKMAAAVGSMPVASGLFFGPGRMDFIPTPELSQSGQE